MRSNWSRLLVLGLLLLLPGLAAAEDGPVITPFQVRSFADSCLRLLTAEKWPELASLYLVPPDAGFDAEHERREIALALQGLAAAFGYAGDAVYADGPPEEIAQLTVQGLSEAYWQERTRSAQVSYRVVFPGFGRGYVSFSVVVYANRMQLRSVSYGLPASAPGTRERMDVLLKKLGG